MLKLKDLIQKLKIYGISNFFKHALYELYLLVWMRGLRKSYSQCGEDLVIDDLLGNKKRGFYVDLGAYDPVRFSNTNRFYQKGWYGINIEPDPELFEKLKERRKRDINLNIGIGNKNEKLYLLKFFPNTVSTFSKESARKYKRYGFKLVKKIKIEVKKLSDLLEKYCKNKQIDFMSIDTEGYDLQVLKSNNWDKWRPKIICIEAPQKDFAGNKVKSSEQIKKYLLKRGYREHLNNGQNCIFVS